MKKIKLETHVRLVSKHWLTSCHDIVSLLQGFKDVNFVSKYEIIPHVCGGLGSSEREK